MRAMRLAVVVVGSGVGMTMALLGVPGVAHADEDPVCRSPNPAEWPAASKPYFLLAVDTSTSMYDSSFADNSCGYPSNRAGGARCAIRNTVGAFSGIVHFGLMAFARRIYRDTSENGGDPPSSCGSYPSNGMSGCDVASLYDEAGVGCSGCGTGYADEGRGANILVPLQIDDYWSATPTPSNVAEVLAWVDNSCTDCRELWADGYTPLNGILRDAYRYLSSEWVYDVWCTTDRQCGTSGDCSDSQCVCTGDAQCPPGSRCTSGSCRYDYDTPLRDAGTERGCRSVNVILLTDGNETCEPEGDRCDLSEPSSPPWRSAEAEAAATALFDGFTLGTGADATHWFARTHVISIGGSLADADRIAAAGDTSEAYVATNEAELSAALANIVSSAIPPEICNNGDDNCNGCTDEGSRVYCNQSKTERTLTWLQDAASTPTPGDCCAWTGASERGDCLEAFRASIAADNPQGDRWLLPCWDPQGAAPQGAQDPEDKWVCSNPGEICDGEDNNCDATFGAAELGTNLADEGFSKCADGDATSQCPIAETCDGRDNDCNGIPDDLYDGDGDLVCPSCTPSLEICDGRDNDCDGRVDEEIADVACGLPDGPAHCQGIRRCAEQENPAGTPGVYVGPNTFSECSWSASVDDTTCDQVDDDCDLLIDEDAPATPCVPEGTPEGLVYYDAELHPNTRCRMGLLACGPGATCQGWVGPLEGGEICNGVDDDCDGDVDEDDGGALPGEGQACGSAVGACEKGQTACVNGALSCVGGTQPAATEVCDGVDGDCDGIADDQDVLADAPEDAGCWTLTPGECGADELCEFGGLDWCAPAGAECQSLGSLEVPCALGALRCVGGGWICDGGSLPVDEVCDGVDNDCNGDVDDGALGAPIGEACGIDEGECDTGTNVCSAGVIECSGQGPEPELCDGLDNDCDGTIDNGDLSIGEACESTYDAADYPGDRSHGVCRPGEARCDPEGSGEAVCYGGVGPTPEICDGVDNDCDGSVDEAGAPADGVDGTADPSDPSRVIGEPCGDAEGLCEPGLLACVNGEVVCEGGVGPQIETCDCNDNDCDGSLDEDPKRGEPALCSPGKTCVDAGSYCVCVETCQGGEFPCPVGTICELRPRSGTDDENRYCMPMDPCGDCAAVTAETDGVVECAPAGTATEGRPVPECICKGQDGCRSPCYHVSCDAGQECVPTGAATGQCRDQNNCFFFGCEAGRVCHDRACVANPCADNPCERGDVCKPNASYTEARCVDSCAEVTCEAAERCVEGECVETGCDRDCGEGKACLEVEAGEFRCRDVCQEEDGAPVCNDGSVCNPLTGQCGDDPCSGVGCPADQQCELGECVEEKASGAAGSGGEGGAGPIPGEGGVSGEAGGQAGAGATAGRAPSTEQPGGKDPRGTWGLATGGGGCACRQGLSRSGPPWGTALLILALVGRRRSRRRPGASLTQKGGAR